MDEDDIERSTERRHQMMRDTEPMAYAMFYAAALAAGKKPSEEAEKAVRAWKSRYGYED